jgi:DNA replicative helicase MCM subunit Mcm2 (Cdc46/Mcm family)
MVVEDDGVLEKRLFFYEGEFAHVLKVMPRETNTLSTVLRSAWDSGHLRTLTKNSPVRATQAHISGIGHITREELRRLLTETEMANGFGNRILWPAVRRSKCLPEGGEPVPVADLVERLKSAVEFARQAGELKRSKEAQELWAQLYPELSEGKPGLLGAITARAEAQVMRLEENYALLDCSATIEVDHLRAALATWDYCERSARWIFESGTGNKMADRILEALKMARQQGMTKWEINERVFNRHATKLDLNRALRLLHQLRLAICVIEKTGGRSAERWFYLECAGEESEESEETKEKPSDTSHTSQGVLRKSESQDQVVEPASGPVSQPPTATASEPDTADSGDHPGGPEESAGPIVGDEKGVGRL